MIRRALLAAALLIAGVASLDLYRDARYLLRASRTIPALLAGIDAGRSPAVLIVMQPEDCLRSGELVARWNELHRAGTAPVTGLVVGSGSLTPRQRQAFEARGVAFPLRAIAAADAAILGEKLGYTSTPFAIVLDVHGRLAASFPASQNVPAEVVARLVAPGQRTRIPS